MTLPPLNTPIQHTGGATCPVHESTTVQVGGIIWPARVVFWTDVPTYTIIARAPADRIKELEAALHYYADDHDGPNDGPWGINSTDFGNVARATLKGATK